MHPEGGSGDGVNTTTVEEPTPVDSREGEKKIPKNKIFSSFRSIPE